MGLEYPGRREMHGPQKTCLVWVVADDGDLVLDLVCLEDDRGAADRKLADAATGKAAPNDNALGVLTSLELEEASRDNRQLLSELFDCAFHNARSKGVNSS